MLLSANSPTFSQAETHADRSTPRLWGLTIGELHDRFWMSRGIQVVRCRSDATVDLAADLFLLVEDDAMGIFNPSDVADRLYWNQAKLMCLRLHDRRRRGYDERIRLDENGQFLRIERQYDRLESRLARFGLTTEAKVAQAWIECAGSASPWNALRRSIPRRERAVASVPGSCYFDNDDRDRVEFVRHLVQVWRTPNATISDLKGPQQGSVWVDPSSSLPTASSRFVGPVWVGRGRGKDEPPLIVGPRVMWDVGNGSESAPNSVKWHAIPPSVMASRIKLVPEPRSRRVVKRMFDICFALIALLMVAPLFPLIMLAIWLEDGRPFLFGHRREKLGGVEFKCWKFRSMYRNAESRKAELAAKNEADGPQFFIQNDPRVTKVGRVLRRFNLDELPQFWNVLVGDMSVVGPRPSPRHENQYCPAWRHARLSVRPGVTGLWQVCRSRKGGNDFQEWIKYDLEYVQKNNLMFDLMIIWRSIQICVRGESRS